MRFFLSYFLLRIIFVFSYVIFEQYQYCLDSSHFELILFFGKNCYPIFCLYIFVECLLRLSLNVRFSFSVSEPNECVLKVNHK